MSLEAYLELLDWTARQVVPGKQGSTPADAPAILQRLRLEPATWIELVCEFGKLFHLVAGRPQVIDATRSRRRHSRFRTRARTRELLAT